MKREILGDDRSCLMEITSWQLHSGTCSSCYFPCTHDMAPGTVVSLGRNGSCLRRLNAVSDRDFVDCSPDFLLADDFRFQGPLPFGTRRRPLHGPPVSEAQFCRPARRISGAIRRIWTICLGDSPPSPDTGHLVTPERPHFSLNRRDLFRDPGTGMASPPDRETGSSVPDAEFAVNHGPARCRPEL